MELPDTQQFSRETNRQRSLALPPEILIHIFSTLSRTKNSQPTLHSCTLVSRLWYSPAVQALYECPIVVGRNFDLFVNTMCPSVNVHVKKNGLAILVKRLDMRMLVHDKSKSLTPRILQRCKENLEEFVAPQAPFAINSFAALSKCTNLRRLDLSSIAYTLDLNSFFNSIKGLDKLEFLYYPPSCRLNKMSEHPSSWPKNLRELRIPGNLHEDSLEFMSSFPPSLRHLGIESCPRLIVSMVYFLLQKLGSQLESLEIKYSRTMFGEGSLDHILFYLPVLRRLSIPAEGITAVFFTCISDISPEDRPPLVELELTCANSENESVVIDCNHIWDAVVDGGLSQLRRLKVHRSLEWDLGREGRYDMKALNQMLQTLALEDVEASGSYETVDAGVWLRGVSLRHA
ncbi:hypothetical protein MMC22_009552 [Lobaria immixta]|nr:hypothetical protein [Lobaria immixta]